MGRSSLTAEEADHVMMNVEPGCRQWCSIGCGPSPGVTREIIAGLACSCAGCLYGALSWEEWVAWQAREAEREPTPFIEPGAMAKPLTLAQRLETYKHGKRHSMSEHDEHHGGPTDFTHRDRRLILEIHSMLSDVRRRQIEMNATADSLTSEISSLQDAVATETTIDQSVLTLVNGIPGLISAAVAKAQAAGATPDQLSAINAVVTQIQSNAQALSAAVTANTPVTGGSTTIAAPGTGAATENAAAPGGKAPTP